MVAFEYIPVYLVDFGFTRSDPWSERFKWLDYDSGNYIELMGSLCVFLLIFVIQGVLILVLSQCRVCRRRKSLQWFTDSVAFKQALMRFFFETFFELVICASVGFKLFEIKSIWNRPDKIAFSELVFLRF